MKEINIVGAGLVGSLLSIFLAKRGYKVCVSERRPDMRKNTLQAGRSINLALSARGLYALHQIGLDEEILKISIPMRARMMHAKDGTLSEQPYGKDSSFAINSVSRAELNKMLMDQAEKTGNVKFNFDQKIESVQLVSDTYCTIATDGAGSVIRDSVMAFHKTEAKVQNENYGYKELSIPPGPDGGFRLAKNFLHIWPRGQYMMIALPNIDGSFTCTLFLPYHGTNSFDELNSAEKIEKFLQTEFPDIQQFIPHMVDEFIENPTGHLTTVFCEPWSVKDKILLMGDAAHAIVPFFGQGANCGFEDVTVFDELLKENPSDWHKLFSDFFELRKQNTDAIAHMALENFIEMRDKVGQKEFLRRKELERRLEIDFPNQFVSRYAMVTFERRPYAEAEKIGKRQDRILDELSALDNSHLLDKNFISKKLET